MQDDSALVELFGNGEHLVLNGPGVSDTLFIPKDGLKGILDAPVTTIYKSSAFQKGSTFLGKKYQQREISLAVYVRGETPEDWQDQDDRLRAMFDYDIDPWDPDSTLTKLSVTTSMSGKRSLWVALKESPTADYSKDPHIVKNAVATFVLVAPQPFWFEDKWEDAPFDYFETGSSGTSEGFVTIANPTPLPMHLRWVVTRGKWTIPDYSWIGKKHQRVPGGEWANRKITLPLLTEVNGGARITVKRSEELMIRDFFNTNLAGQMNGIFFQHLVPPFTPETNLPVKVEEAPTGGSRIEVYCEHRWPRAWGNRA
ncbi:hypothetical protein [Nocardia brasiliensis]|uniref:hypothetical protein n=1 Tax=Nocardia brasiliensis TaxID=37326 RepID=UPI0024538BFF|nr:hypothetical protein [Nocardia brasiliensis]